MHGKRGWCKLVVIVAGAVYNNEITPPQLSPTGEQWSFNATDKAKRRDFIVEWSIYRLGTEIDLT